MTPTPRPTPLLLDAAHTALLVIDVQNDFASPEGFFAQNGLDVSLGHAVVEPIAALVERVRPLGVHIVYTKSVRTQPQPQRLTPSRPFYAGGTPFASGSWGVELDERLSPAPGETVLEKPRYSVFQRTALADELRARGVDTVLLAGITTNCCIDSSMRDAYMLDFNVVVVADCVAGFGGEEALHDATLRNAELLFGVVATADVVIGALSGSAAQAIA
jgi:nicotinamidase-related amidase